MGNVKQTSLAIADDVFPPPGSLDKQKKKKKEAFSEVEDEQLAEEQIKLNPASLATFHDNIKNSKHHVMLAVKQQGTCLQYASERLRNDKKVVLAAVGNMGEALKFASVELRGDKDVCLEAVRNNGEAYEFLSTLSVKKDRDIALLLAQNPLFLIIHSDKIDPELFNDIDFMTHAVRTHHQIFEKAGERVKKDKSIVLTALEKKLDFRHQMDEELRGDRDIIKFILSIAPERLEEFQEVVTSDKELMKFVAYSDGSCLFSATAILKDDEEVVLAAVSCDGSALEFASKRLRNDKKIVRAAIFQSYHGFESASENLRKNDPELLLLALKGRNRRIFIKNSVIDNFDQSIWGNEEIVLQMIQIDPNLFSRVSKKMKSRKSFLMKVMRIAPNLYVDLPTNLKEDLEIMVSTGLKLEFPYEKDFLFHLMSLPNPNSWSILKSVSDREDLRNDFEFVKCVIQKGGQNVNFLEFVGEKLKEDENFVHFAAKNLGVETAMRFLANGRLKRSKSLLQRLLPIDVEQCVREFDSELFNDFDLIRQCRQYGSKKQMFVIGEFLSNRIQSLEDIPLLIRVLIENPCHGEELEPPILGKLDSIELRNNLEVLKHAIRRNPNEFIDRIVKNYDEFENHYSQTEKRSSSSTPPFSNIKKELALIAIRSCQNSDQVMILFDHLMDVKRFEGLNLDRDVVLETIKKWPSLLLQRETVRKKFGKDIPFLKEVVKIFGIFGISHLKDMNLLNDLDREILMFVMQSQLELLLLKSKKKEPMAIKNNERKKKKKIEEEDEEEIFRGRQLVVGTSADSSDEWDSDSDSESSVEEMHEIEEELEFLQEELEMLEDEGAEMLELDRVRAEIIIEERKRNELLKKRIENGIKFRKDKSSIEKKEKEKNKLMKEWKEKCGNFSLEHFPSRKDDEEFVSLLVSLQGFDLQFASKRLQDNENVVRNAILEFPQAIKFASRRILENEEFVMDTIFELSKKKQTLRHLIKNVNMSKKIIYQCMKMDPLCGALDRGVASDEIRNDEKFVKKCFGFDQEKKRNQQVHHRLEKKKGLEIVFDMIPNEMLLKDEEFLLFLISKFNFENNKEIRNVLGVFIKKPGGILKLELLKKMMLKNWRICEAYLSDQTVMMRYPDLIFFALSQYDGSFFRMVNEKARVFSDNLYFMKRCAEIDGGFLKKFFDKEVKNRRAREIESRRPRRKFEKTKSDDVEEEEELKIVEDTDGTAPPPPPPSVQNLFFVGKDLNSIERKNNFNEDLTIQPLLLRMKDILMESVRSNSRSLKYASEELKDDFELVKLATEFDEFSILYASHRIKSKREFFFSLLKRKPVIFSVVKTQRFSEKEVSKYDYFARKKGFQNISKMYRNDREIVCFVVSKIGSLLKFASRELRNEEEIVWLAVRQDPKAFQFASQRIREEDEELVKFVVSKFGEMILCCGPKFLNDISFISLALQNTRKSNLDVVCGFERNNILFGDPKDPRINRSFGDNIKTDQEFILDCISKFGESAVLLASSELQMNKNFVSQVLRMNGKCLRFLLEFELNPLFENEMLAVELFQISIVQSPEIVEYLQKKEKWKIICDLILRENRDMCLDLVKREGKWIRFLDKKFRDDEDFILQALSSSSSHEMLKYASDRIRRESEKAVKNAIEKNFESVRFSKLPLDGISDGELKKKIKSSKEKLWKKCHLNGEEKLKKNDEMRFHQIGIVVGMSDLPGPKNEQVKSNCEKMKKLLSSENECLLILLNGFPKEKEMLSFRKEIENFVHQTIFQKSTNTKDCFEFRLYVTTQHHRSCFVKKMFQILKIFVRNLRPQIKSDILIDFSFVFDLWNMREEAKRQDEELEGEEEEEESLVLRDIPIVVEGFVNYLRVKKLEKNKCLFRHVFVLVRTKEGEEEEGFEDEGEKLVRVLEKKEQWGEWKGVVEECKNVQIFSGNL